MFETLDDVEDDIHRRLVRGARDRKSAMHTPVVGTADADVRVMVLRAYDRQTRTLRLHTDARSPKAATIGEGAPVGLLFYDAGAKVQIRVHGTGRIETGSPLAEQAWRESTNFAKRCYLAVDGPGAPLAEPGSGLPPQVEGEMPSDEQLVPARENFAILLVEAQHFDWLYLANSGHRRVQVDGGERRWVLP